MKLIQETFGNIKETILSNNYDYILSKFKYHTEQNKISGQKKDFYFIIPRPILEVFIILMIFDGVAQALANCLTINYIK